MGISTLRIALAATVALASFGCSRNAAAPDDAHNIANTLTGGDQASAASNPQCKLFTRGEIAAYEGTTVNAGTDAAMGTGCQWVDSAGNGSAMVQIVAADDHEPASAAPGFKTLKDVGSEGFIVPQMGGWHAAAIAGAHSINVLTGGKSDEAKTTAFLKEAIKRAGG